MAVYEECERSFTPLAEGDDEPCVVARIDWVGSRFGIDFDDTSYGGLRHVIPQGPPRFSECKPAPLYSVGTVAGTAASRM